MKIAHCTWWAPRLSGMFESTKDQIKYERAEGHDSIFIDVKREQPEPGQLDDGWLRPSPWDEALTADVIVMHAFIPEKIKNEVWGKKPCVAILHGPTEHMLWTEFTTGRKHMAFNLHIDISWTYDATVVLNRHEYDIMKLYDEKGRIHYIPNSIDLARYKAENGMKWPYTHRPAILSCDTLRIEKLPSHIIWAMPKVAEKVPDARLNLFGLTMEGFTTWRNIFVRSKERKLENLCENTGFELNDLRPFQAGADIGFNNNLSGILSRVGMEMMANGVPIIAYSGDYTEYHPTVWDLDSIAETVCRCWEDLQNPDVQLRERTRQYALENFDRARWVKKYIELYEQLLNNR